MKKMFFNVVYMLFFTSSFAQNMSQKIEKAYQQFEADSQFRHAISSFYIINAKTGEVVFDRNSQIGLAPASTQKIVTAATAFELLGKNYRYKTVFTIQHFDAATDHLVIYGSGDPTLGSWRFKATKDTILFDNVISKIKSKFNGSIEDVLISVNGDSRQIPSGWTSEDIANYYGAASHDLNWRENQYDFNFVPGKKVGDPTELVDIPKRIWLQKYIINECKTGPVGSGDNAYIYFVPGYREVLIQGTVPAGVNKFTISGADFDPPRTFSFSFVDYAISQGIKVRIQDVGRLGIRIDTAFESEYRNAGFYTHYSPTLDSIVYWFLQKSINLYGEALIKAFAYQKNQFGSTDTGVTIVKAFWKQKGIDDEELNIMDGSGLSPQNRVTTHAQVEILKFAKTREWFPYFYQALPTYNGMKMKSGSIRDVKGFCGYQQSADGNEYIFSFLVNNYSGRSSVVVNKMYRVLDVLK